VTKRILGVVMLGAVGWAPATAQSPPTFAPPAPIWIDGSTGVMPLVTVLAATYRAQQPAFPALPAINFGGGLGASARIAAVKSGHIDIALASHGVDAADIERQGLKIYKFAAVPVGFAIPIAVGVTNLTEAQVCDIYAGRITSWKQVGGPDLEIAVATRPKGEVDADVVMAGIPCMTALTPHARVVVKEKPEDMAAWLDATPGAFGMTSAIVTWQSTKLRLASLGGIAPTPDNVRAGRHRLIRESFLIYAATSRREVAAFLAFIRGPEGARVISQSGAIPR
jgi:phosphate transport system substrate-binding protein